jgi:Predicted phosphotransacetylase
MLLKNEVDDAVRGSLSSTKILSALKKEYNHKIYRTSFFKIK